MCVADVAPADVEVSGISPLSQSEPPSTSKNQTSMIMMWIMTCSNTRKLRSVLAPAKDANPGTSKNKKVHSIVRYMWLARRQVGR